MDWRTQELGASSLSWGRGSLSPLRRPVDQHCDVCRNNCIYFRLLDRKRCGWCRCGKTRGIMKFNYTIHLHLWVTNRSFPASELANFCQTSFWWKMELACFKEDCMRALEIYAHLVWEHLSLPSALCLYAFHDIEYDLVVFVVAGTLSDSFYAIEHSFFLFCIWCSSWRKAKHAACMGFEIMEIRAKQFELGKNFWMFEEEL